MLPQFYRIRTNFTALLGLLLCASAFAAAPQRVELEQAGETVAFYLQGGKRYRALEPNELASWSGSGRIGIEAKLQDHLGNNLQLYGMTFAEIQFVLEPKASVDANPGDNIWLGGTLKREAGGLTTFLVEQSAMMKGDLELYQDRRRMLDTNPAATAEEYLRLAWWLSLSKDQSLGLSNKEYDKYIHGYEETISKAIQIDLAALDGLAADPKPENVAARLIRYQSYVQGFGTVLPEGEVAWYLEACRAVLKDNKRLADRLSSPAGMASVTDKDMARLIGSSYWLLGHLTKQALQKDADAASIWAKGIVTDPRHPRLIKGLQQAGYVNYEGTWMTAEQARRTRQNEQNSTNQTSAAQTPSVTSAPTRPAPPPGTRDALIAGKDLEKIRTIVDPLLSKPSTESLDELSEMLPTLPEDIARYALWQVGGLAPSVDRNALLRNALTHTNPLVQEDAIALLCERGELPDIQILGEFFKQNKYAGLAPIAVQSMRRIPGNSAIDALLGFASSEGLSEAILQEIAQALAAETGQSYADDLFGWRAWWDQNRKSFKRSNAP